MLKTLPCSALRTLEAVVRLRGFGRAAEELNVSQSAVSQHIKQLEEWLGRKLLIRQGRQTVPSEQGERLASAVREGFGAIEAVCDDLRDGGNANKRGILVAAPPGFAFVWLLPRLLQFDEAHPDIPVSLSTDPKSYDPSTSDADIIISYCAGGFPNQHAELLMTERMSPVCSPEIAKRVNSPDDLADHVILQDVPHAIAQRCNWDFWAKETDVALPNFPRTRQYSQANMVIHAAESGAGIAMGRGPLVQDALRRGTLVEPFDQGAHSQSSYWLVCEHSALKKAQVRAFHSWVLCEAAKQSPHA